MDNRDCLAILRDLTRRTRPVEVDDLAQNQNVSLDYTLRRLIELRDEGLVDFEYRGSLLVWSATTAGQRAVTP